MNKVAFIFLLVLLGCAVQKAVQKPAQPSPELQTKPATPRARAIDSFVIRPLPGPPRDMGKRDQMIIEWVYSWEPHYSFVLLSSEDPALPIGKWTHYGTTKQHFFVIDTTRHARECFVLMASNSLDGTISKLATR